MKYLIYCGPGIGDLILVLPMAKSIRDYDPNAYIKIITTSNKNRIKNNLILFKLQCIINDYDYYSSHELLHNIAFLMRNGIKKFDYGFVLQYTDNNYTSIFPSIFINLSSRTTCGIRITSNRNIKYNKYIDREKGKRIIDYSISMLEAFGISKSKDINNILDINKINSYQFNIPYNHTKRTITLCIGTASVSMKINGNLITNDTKNWDYINWLHLAFKLSKDYNVFLLGGKKEAKELENIKEFQLLPPPIFNFIGKTSLGESLYILQQSNLVVGADTGLMHCAGALGKTSLTLFGCTDYHEYLPMGSQSQYITANEICSPCFGTKMSVLCKHKNCMKHLTVEMVYNRINHMLNRD